MKCIVCRKDAEAYVKIGDIGAAFCHLDYTENYRDAPVNRKITVVMQ